MNGLQLTTRRYHANHCNLSISGRVALYICAVFFSLLLPLNSILADNQLATNHARIIIAHQGISTYNQSLLQRLSEDLQQSNLQSVEYLIKDTPVDTAAFTPGDIVIAIGSHTTKQLLDAKISSPILSVLMPRHLAESFDTHYPDQRNWSSLLIDQPLQRHFHLITAILGKQKKAGILLGPTTRQNEKDIERAASLAGHDLVEEFVADNSQLMTSLRRVNTQADVLLTLPDPQVFNRKTARGILLSTYRHKLPIIGFSRAYVKAGAIAAVYSQPEQISDQTVKLVRYYLEHGYFSKRQYYPENFSVALNGKVARSLGINLDASSTIVRHIKEAEH